jgi:hypothetical protein
MLGDILRPSTTPVVAVSAEVAEPRASTATHTSPPIDGDASAVGNPGFLAKASRIDTQYTAVANEGRHRVATFDYESRIAERVDASLTTAKRNEFEADFCRQLARLEEWAAQQQWPPYKRPELQVVVSDCFRISKSLVPAWYGQHGRMEFPAWRVIRRSAAIAHELVHIFYPNGNRFLAEGLAVHLQDHIGENPAFPNFGRPLHALARELLQEMLPELAAGEPSSLGKVRLLELDGIATPSPLTLRIDDDFYGEEPRGQARLYAIAGSFVQFLIAARGMEKFRCLYELTPLAPLQQDAGSPDRWRDVYGVALAALEWEWKSLIAGARALELG